uniref:Peptidase S1 domain-containing protein n=1 Tax=Anopheles minimus TaxID=112268 RepID=A0A182VUF6_9DIPT
MNKHRIEQAMMPNVRESLDDCHMRYYKHNLPSQEYSVFDRPRLKFREFPHLAFIGWTRSKGTVQWDCIGTLVWENFVLTSALCTRNAKRVAPDVTRLGNPNQQADGEVQQIKIAEIIRHPEWREGSRYHNIALLRLEAKVELDATVVPACLWNKEEIHFRNVEVAKWSVSGTPTVSKVEVHPVPDACERAIEMRWPFGNDTLQNSDLCVDTNATDLCLGNFGTFVQVSLHHNSKISPFVIAIGSPASTSCDETKVSLYTKVFPYVQWIRSTIEASGEPAWDWKFRETECALRYVNLRHYEKDVLIGETDTEVLVTPGGRHIEPKYTHAMVEIHFGYYSNVQECYGLIIDQDTVLTLAQCTTKYGKRASYVMYLGNERNAVVKHYNHPGYRDGQLHNDIGILKMRMNFTFFGLFVPHCISHGDELPEDEVEQTGSGRRDINHFSLHDKSVDVFEPQSTQLIIRAKILPFDDCFYPKEFSANLSRGLTDEHLCFGNEPYLVPETCDQARGGPIGGTVMKFNKSFRTAYALNLFGRDCGFGWPAVGVRLASHAHWLKSILLPDYRKDSGSLHFFHSDLEENDICRHVDGTNGLCVDVARCPKVRYEFSVNRRVAFCSSSKVVCCPFENMVNETSPAGRELDECEDRYQEDRARTSGMLLESGPIGDDYPHLVMIGWKMSGDEQVRWNCRGTIITPSAILTSAKCLQQQTSAPSLIRLGTNDTAPLVDVKETIIHPKYDKATRRNDLAVIKLKDTIAQRASSKFPACIWTNQTHTPFRMIQLVINETEDSYVYPTAKYNTDCSEFEEGLASSQLCVDVQPPNTVVSEGDPMFWSKPLPDGSSVQYLVGMMNYATANDRSVNVHTQIGSVLIPAGDITAPNIEDIILPNKRESLTDCFYRHFKYGKNSLVKPASGQPTYLREFAHMAAIGWTQPDSSITWNCGGSLIWENYILTAAHCVQDANNNKPDVARFGDLDLFNDTDDQYAQQIKIVEIIRHPEHKFRARYHDIALMRLEHSVKVHDTVAPTCLWSEDEIRYKTFEATGWGDTGFGEGRTPILLKVSLTPVDKERCNQHYMNIRGLRAGLHANQLCAGDARMDTCPGDSGGPLQVKLLHNTRISPFLVGVTSFGTACGLSVPGVYTRVAPYVPWIRTVLSDRGENATEWSFQPQACAVRYAQYREHEPRVVLHKGNGQETVDLSEAHLFDEASVQLVSIHWNETDDRKECFGVIIDESTVVTLARCTTKNGKPPSFVRYLGNERNDVTHSYKHPNWTDGSIYGDVGLLRLKEPLQFNSDFTPACIWERSDIPNPEFEMTGRGLLELNTIYVDGEPLEKSAQLNRTIDLLGVVHLHNGTNCSASPDLLTAEHLCFGEEPFLVPGTCQQSPGGPMQREIMRSSRSLMYVYALNLFGRDCGYGESAVGVRLAVHMPWMESVLLPQMDEQGDRTEPFIFLNHDLEEGDICTVDSGTGEGICTSAVNCPMMLYRFRQNHPVRFCQTGSLLCCPREYIRNETDAEWREIDNCVNKPIIDEDVFNLKSHLVSVRWTVGDETRGCVGTMITSRTFVTAASCLDDEIVQMFVHLELEQLSIEVLLPVEKLIVHPDYESTSKRHNIALISTANRPETFFGKVPACLWSNTTHTPFHLQQVGLQEEDKLAATLAFTKFNTDCDRRFGAALGPHELCLDVEYPENLFEIHDGTPAFWTHQESINYMVGIASYSAPNDSSVFLHTRIAPYVSWIKSVL